MKEEEKLLNINKIKEFNKIYNLFIEKTFEFNELENNEFVKRYIKLNNELVDLKTMLECFDIKLSNCDIDDIDIMFESFTNPLTCKHELWIYIGSYYSYINCDGEIHETCCGNENDYSFQYNKYECIDCNKIVIIEDYKKFEEEHIVLKENNENRYKSEYSNLLKENSGYESQKILVNKYGLKR